MSSKLTYVANARLPSSRAHPYQIVQMSDAFCAAGTDVELVVPNRRQEFNDLPPLEEYYDTPMAFACTQLFCIDFLPYAEEVPSFLAKLIYYIQTFTFVLNAVIYTVRTVEYDEVIYSRSLFYSCIMSLFPGYQVVHEVHGIPNTEWRRRVVGWFFERLMGVVTICDGLKTTCATYTSADLVVAHDGVQLEKFTKRTEATREDLGVPTDAKLVTYAGTIASNRGVDTLIRAMEFVRNDIHLVLVGGNEDQYGKMRTLVGEFPDNITLVGHVSPDRVPPYLHTGDVLAVPNSAEDRAVARHSSPLKLFEYMAAAKPIVASDIPSHREIVDESTAYLFEADDPRSLADTIEQALDDPETSERVRLARERVESYSWESRAKSILTQFVGEGDWSE